MSRIEQADHAVAKSKTVKSPSCGQPAFSFAPDLFLSVSRLNNSHHGVSKELARSYAQAADICFDRHHKSPIGIAIKTKGKTIFRGYKWRKPNDRAKAAWANKDDATRDGAYGVCIASVEVAEGLFAVGRAETRTGADYYLGKTKLAKDFERAYRLEVSGTDGSEGDATTRLKKKLQTAKGKSELPAIAAVVSFRDCVVLYGNGLSAC